MKDWNGDDWFCVVLLLVITLVAFQVAVSHVVRDKILDLQSEQLED